MDKSNIPKIAIFNTDNPAVTPESNHRTGALTPAQITDKGYNRILSVARQRGWIDIFQALAPSLHHASEHIGKHVTCPRHGTKNANGQGNGFRIYDNDSGNSICNTCGPNNDGIATIAFANNSTYEQAAQAVAEYLGLSFDSTKKTWQERWQAGAETGQSAYLAGKGVKAYPGIRFLNDRGHSILIPMRTMDGKITGIQQIFDTPQIWLKNLGIKDGKKWDVSKSKKKGAFFPIGEMTADTGLLYLAEGYADAATAYEAMERTTLCCFDAGNILTIAKAIKGKFPNAQLIVVADNDKAGKDAALAVVKNYPDTRVALPDFSGLNALGKDFNDLKAIAGIGEVRRQIENAAPMRIANSRTTKAALPRKVQA